jgi:hypothetical protein
MTTRLSASVEAASLCRRAESEGGFAAILHKGDPKRGTLLLIIRERGQYVTCLERTLVPDGFYAWTRGGPASSAGEGELTDFIKRRARFDEDSWLIELDIALPERFIAETTSLG